MEQNKMREFQIVHQALHQCCPELHAKRLNALMAASEALFHSDTLTLTQLGRKMPATCHVKHSIKRMDRLLGNHLLHNERMAVYQWQATLLGTATMPVILVDWEDIRKKATPYGTARLCCPFGALSDCLERAFTLEEHNTDTGTSALPEGAGIRVARRQHTADSNRCGG